MQYARYKTDLGEWARVSAGEYDPQKHGDELCCADPECSARVYFRSADGVQGGSYDENSFVSVRRADHREGCPELSHTYKNYNDTRLDEAAEKGYHVLLNLNFDLGHPNHASLGRRVSNDIQTPYNQWREKYPHATLRAKSIQQYFEAVSKVIRMDPDMLDRLRIGHMQQVRHYSTFFMDDKKAMFQRLFEEMIQAEAGYDGLVVGFPRHITFRPLKSEFKNSSEAGQSIRGNTVVMHAHSGARHILFNRLVLADENMRPDILSYDFNDVIAVPMLDRELVKRAHDKFHEKGQTSVAFLDWKITSKAQYKPAQGAMRVDDLDNAQVGLPGLDIPLNS